MKTLITEKKTKRPEIEVIDVLEDITDLEGKLLNIKKKLKLLVSQIQSKNSEINPMNIPLDGGMTKKNNSDKYEKDTEFDHLDKKRKDDD